MPLSPATRKATLLSDTSPSATSTGSRSSACAAPQAAASKTAEQNARDVDVMVRPPDVLFVGSHSRAAESRWQAVRLCVMAGLVPAIHVFDANGKGRRGCPQQVRA